MSGLSTNMSQSWRRRHMPNGYWTKVYQLQSASASILHSAKQSISLATNANSNAELPVQSIGIEHFGGPSRRSNNGLASLRPTNPTTKISPSLIQTILLLPDVCWVPVPFYITRIFSYQMTTSGRVLFSFYSRSKIKVYTRISDVLSKSLNLWDKHFLH